MTPSNRLTATELKALSALVRLAPSNPPPLLIGACAVRCWVRPEALRATRDVDVAVMLADWDAAIALLELCHANGFEVQRDGLRLTHLDTGVRIDLVPFGALENPEGTLRHPGGSDAITTVGLREATENAIPIPVGGATLLIPRLEDLALHKLLIWQHRRAPRDLRDCGHLLRAAPAVDDIDDTLATALADGVVRWEHLGVWRVVSEWAAGSHAEQATAAFDTLAQGSDANHQQLVHALKDEGISFSDISGIVARIMKRQ